MLWTDDQGLQLEGCLNIIERTSKAMHRRFGHKFVAKEELHLFVFSTVEGIRGYEPKGGLFGSSRDYVGFYAWAFQPRIVCLRGLADLFPLDFSNYLAHEYAHRLHLQQGRSSFPLWLVEGVATWIAAEVAPPRPSLLLGRRRIWSYLNASGSLIEGEDLAAMSSLDSGPRLADQGIRQICLREVAFYMQSQCLFDWLYTNCREALVQASLCPSKSPVSNPRQFTKHFKYTPNKAMTHALEAHRAVMEEPVIEEPGERSLREASVRRFYDILSDTDSSAATQRLVLRLLPSVAFGLDAGPVRAFHRRSQGELRDIAALTLDLLAEDRHHS